MGNFYDEFINECNKPTLLESSSGVNEYQKDTIHKDCTSKKTGYYGNDTLTGYFNQLPQEAHQKVAHSLVWSLTFMNDRQNATLFEEVINSKDKVKDIKILQALIKQFGTSGRDTMKPLYSTPHREIRSTQQRNDNNEAREKQQTKFNKKVSKFLDLAEWLLAEIENEKIRYVKDTRTKRNGENIASREQLNKFLQDTATKYNIRNSSRLIKQLIIDLHPLNG